MLTGTFAPNYGGGARQALALCRKLEERGVSSFVVTKRNGKGQMPRQRVQGIDVFRLNRGTSKIQRKLYFVRVLGFLLSQKNSYEIIHAHGIFPFTYAGIIAARLQGKKILAKMITSGVDDPITIKRRFLGGIQLKMFLLIDKIISISSELSASFKECCSQRHKLVEIPNGVDTAKFRPSTDKEKTQLREKLTLPAEQTIFTFVGVINQRKGVGVLVEAWKESAGNIPSAVLLLVGPRSKSENDNADEDYVNKLSEKIKNNNLMKNIILTGHVDNPEEYLKASDVFVFPSWREGLPNALLEAMSCGIICIAAKIACVTDTISDGKDGLWFRPGDVKHLAELMVQTAGDCETRKLIGHNARATIESRFDLDKIADRYVKLYKQLLNGNRKGGFQSEG